MFARSRGFRLAIDEVEKSLYLADMEIAALYAGLVPDRKARPSASSRMIQAEYAADTRSGVLALSGRRGLCERFPGFRRRFDRVRPMIDQANRWQVELAQRCAQRARARRRLLPPLLMTMNCIAAGLGWTG